MLIKEEPLADIVERAQSGSRDAFDDLIMRFEGKVMKTALYLTRNLADAQDIAQEVYRLNITVPKIVIEKNKSQISIHPFLISFDVPAVNSQGKSFFRNITLEAPFSIVEGEVVVLGASQIKREGDRPGAAIITIVTAKIL